MQGERRSSVILNFDGWSNTEKWTGSDLWSGYFPVSVTAGTQVLQKTLPVWESGKFRLWRSVLFWANFSVCSHRVDNLPQVSCWCFVDGDIMPLLYCFQSWHTFLKQCGGRLHRLQIAGNMTFTVCWHTADYWIKRPCLFFNSHVFPSLLSDGGVWQSSLQKAPFPSGSVDQLTQETLCQARGSLAKCYLCQVSLSNTLVISCFASVSCTFVLRLCHFLVITV